MVLKIKIKWKIARNCSSLYWYEKNFLYQLNDDHKYFYTPGSLLSLVENSLDNLNYKVEILRDNMKDINLETQEKFNMDKIYKSTKPYMKLKWLLKKFHNQTLSLQKIHQVE